VYICNIHITDRQETIRGGETVSWWSIKLIRGEVSGSQVETKERSTNKTTTLLFKKKDEKAIFIYYLLPSNQYTATTASSLLLDRKVIYFYNLLKSQRVKKTLENK
jgi:hypothetical protein